MSLNELAAAKQKWIGDTLSDSDGLSGEVRVASNGNVSIAFRSRTRKLQNRVENNSLAVGDKEWTPHDLRRTGATMMQKLKISREIINLCQNHVIGSKVDRVYLLDDYANEKREAWNKLGDRLEAILNTSNVASLKSA